MKVCGRELHPLCAAFPEADAEDLAALERSIRHGYDKAQPIVLYQGMILDGRHRGIICDKLGIMPTVRVYAGECGSPAAFVLAANVARRHLTVSQRNMIAAEIATLAQGRPDANPPAGGITQADAAAALGGSVRGVQRSAAVRKADPALAEQVKRGEVSTAAAERQVRATTQAARPSAARSDAQRVSALNQIARTIETWRREYITVLLAEDRTQLAALLRRWADDLEGA